MLENNNLKTIGVRPKRNLFNILVNWEVFLLVTLFFVFVMNSNFSPYFLDIYNLFDWTQSLSEKAIIALALALLIISGEIDISVASIIAISSLVMGLVAANGYSSEYIIISGLLTGAFAGALNGFIVVCFKISSIVATIATMSIFRGISYMVLGDKAYTEFPDSFTNMSGEFIFDLIPLAFVVFLILCIIYTYVLHYTVIGRKIFSIGSNSDAAVYSGINVSKYKFLLFIIVGISAGLAAVFLTSRISSVRPNIAEGLELEIITIVVLGGVSINGGKGSILGIFLAVLLVGFLSFGLSLINLPGIVITIIIGALLIGVLIVPKLLDINFYKKIF